MVQNVRKRRLLQIAAGLALLLLVTTLWSVHSYPRATRVLVFQLVDSGFRESWNLFRFMFYMIRHTDQYEQDPETGYFTVPRRAASDPFREGVRRFHLGEFSEAVQRFQSAIEEQGENETRLFWLGAAYLRLAEADNCLASLRGGSEPTERPGGEHQPWCTLPLRRPHVRQEATRAAAATFERLLERYDDEDPVYRWLLNLTYMTLDGYPDRVPEPYRIDNEFTDQFYGARAESEQHPELVFFDRAAELGVATFDAGRGVAVEDFDGDGFLDIATGGSYDPVRLYRNEGGATFRDVTAGSGLESAAQPQMISAVDYDNDGRIDLFVAAAFQPSRLFRNTGGLRFEEVTEGVGLAPGEDGKRIAAWTPAWGDVDNDGDLDLLLTSWGLKVPLVSGYWKSDRADARLYLQEEGRFVNRTKAFEIESLLRDQAFVGAAFGDYDDDGFVDLFLSSSLKRGSLLLHNEAGERFGLASRHDFGFVAAFVDVDHDGRLEIFQGGIADGRNSIAKAVFGMDYGDPDMGRTRILRQDADGAFRAVDGFFPGEMPIGSMGSSFGDLDNDGCLDFYLGTGSPESWFVLPNLMYRGRRDGTGCALATTNISHLHGFGNLQKGHGIVFFDMDDDGDQEIYSALGGMWPGDRWTNQLFVNESELDSSWIKIRLRGRRTNRFGVGCRIRVTALTPTGELVVRTHHMDGKTSFGSAPLLAHLGLGDAVGPTEVRVFWPGSGRWHAHPAELGTLNVLVEPQAE